LHLSEKEKEEEGWQAGTQCAKKYDFAQEIEIKIVTKQQKTREYVQKQKNA
jgi:hypothetical protein